VVRHLNARGVQAGVHYPFPIHRLSAYSSLATGGDFREAEAWAAECLSLPLYPELTDDQIARVVDSLPPA
jgi:dTDP-4-amino-4,6-dideoxygalactose transaminase